MAKRYAGQFPEVVPFTMNEVFGSWQKAQKTHFEVGGTLDQIHGIAPRLLD